MLIYKPPFQWPVGIRYTKSGLPNQAVYMENINCLVLCAVVFSPFSKVYLRSESKTKTRRKPSQCLTSTTWRHIMQRKLRRTWSDRNVSGILWSSCYEHSVSVDSFWVCIYVRASLIKDSVFRESSSVPIVTAIAFKLSQNPTWPKLKVIQHVLHFVYCLFL